MAPGRGRAGEVEALLADDEHLSLPKRHLRAVAEVALDERAPLVYEDWAAPLVEISALKLAQVVYGVHRAMVGESALASG